MWFLFGYCPYQAVKFEKNAEKFYKVKTFTDPQTHRHMHTTHMYTHHTHPPTHPHTHTHTHTQRERDRERQTNNSKTWLKKVHFLCTQVFESQSCWVQLASDWKLLHQ